MEACRGAAGQGCFQISFEPMDTLLLMQHLHLLVAACLVSIGFCQDPPPLPPGGLRYTPSEARKILGEPGRSSSADLQGLLKRAVEHVRDHGERAVAILVPGATVECEVPIQAKLKTFYGIDVAGSASKFEAGASLSWREFKWKIDVEPRDRMASTGIELVVAIQPDGSKLKRVYNVGFEYSDNRTYLGALGLDGRTIPGVSTTLQVLRRVLERESLPSDAKEVGPSVMGAVGVALKNELPPLFASAGKFDHLRIGEGWRLETASGKVAVSYVEVERLATGQRMGSGVRWTESAVTADVEFEFGVRGRTVGAGSGLTVKFVEGKPGDGASPMLIGLANRVAQGDAEAISVALASRLAPIRDSEATARAIKALGAMGRPALAEAGRIVGLGEPGIGGVALYFDPEILASGIAPGDAACALARLTANLDRGESFAVTTGADDIVVEAVSLNAALEAGTATLGSLSRLHGAVIDARGDVLLLGESGDVQINLDVLAVAARAVWKEHRAPYVSLDPDPVDFALPHTVRVGALAAEDRDTELVRTMIDADYVMKRISLGADRTGVAGFESLYDIVKTSSFEINDQRPFRAWLVPMPSKVADIWKFDRDGRQVFLFDSRIQVLSESMRRVGNMLIGTGESDTASTTAAAEFTSHFDAIAERRPEFRRLRTVFDCTKLFAVLAQQGISHPLLDRLASRKSKSVAIPPSFAGIGPIMVTGTTVALTGGAEARHRLRGHHVRRTAEIEPLIGIGAGQKLRVSVPKSISLTAAEVLNEHGDLEVSRAMDAMMRGDCSAAEAALDRAIEKHPETPARAMRALLRFRLGDEKGARADVDLGIGATPELLVVRALLDVCQGDVGRGAAEAGEALRRHPDDEAVVEMASRALQLAGDFSASEDAVLRLLALDPLSTEGIVLYANLDLCHRLGPARARKRVDRMRRAPIAAVQHLSDGADALLSESDPLSAIPYFERCVDVLSRELPRAGAADIYLRERAETLLAAALHLASGLPGVDSPNLARRSRALLDNMLRLHPDWPCLRLMVLQYDPAAAPSDLAAAIEAATESRVNADPILEELAGLWGTGRIGAWFAVSLLVEARSRPASELEQSLFEHLIPLLGEGMEAEWLRVIWQCVGRPAADANHALAASLLKMPAPLPSDPLTVWAAGVFTTHYDEKCISSDATRQRASVLKRFLNASALDDLPFVAAQQIAIQRNHCMRSLAAISARTADLLIEWENLKIRAANGKLDPKSAKGALEVVRNGALRRAGAGLRLFDAMLMAAYAEPVVARVTAESELLTNARDAARLLPEGIERDEALRAIESWQRELGATGRSAPEDLGPMASARFDALLKEATRPSDVHALTVVARMGAIAARLLPPNHPEAERLAAMHARLATRVRGISFTYKRHDWSGW